MVRRVFKDSSEQQLVLLNDPLGFFKDRRVLIFQKNSYLALLTQLEW